MTTETGLKDEIVSFKLDSKTKKSLEEVCLKLHSTKSHELRLFVHQFIKIHNSKQVSLNEYRKKQS